MHLFTHKHGHSVTDIEIHTIMGSYNSIDIHRNTQKEVRIYLYKSTHKKSAQKGT